MTTITIPLSEESLAQLYQRAEQTGLTPEEFLQQHIEEVLKPADEAFQQAADHVFRKNEELYRRLS